MLAAKEFANESIEGSMEAAQKPGSSEMGNHMPGLLQGILKIQREPDGPKIGPF